MNYKPTARWILACSVSLPITVALIFLMTRLILPGQDDPVVARMLFDLELRRAPREIDELRIPESRRLLSKRPSRPPPIRPHTPIREGKSKTIEAPQERHIDWQLMSQEAVLDGDEEKLKRWMIENGHSDYTTIMQGPLPITNSARATLPPSQEDATGYMNTYGDKEIKISKNCVAKSQVAGRLDISDFSEKLPMRIDCKSPAREKFTFERE